MINRFLRLSVPASEVAAVAAVLGLSIIARYVTKGYVVTGYVGEK